MPHAYLVDANTFRLYKTGRAVTINRVLEHISVIALSSITVEEMVVGRLSIINRARSGKSPITLADAHEEFTELMEDIAPFPIVAFSPEAESIFRQFPASIRRIGSQDCRLAAHAIAHNLVVTRNLRDFEAIGAPCEDWSA